MHRERLVSSTRGASYLDRRRSALDEDCRSTARERWSPWPHDSLANGLLTAGAGT
jgi:hypothetical protein